MESLLSVLFAGEDHRRIVIENYFHGRRGKGPKIEPSSIVLAQGVALMCIHLYAFLFYICIRLSLERVLFCAL